MQDYPRFFKQKINPRDDQSSPPNQLESISNFIKIFPLVYKLENYLKKKKAFCDRVFEFFNCLGFLKIVIFWVLV